MLSSNEETLHHVAWYVKRIVPQFWATMHLTNSPNEAHKGHVESAKAESTGAPVHEIEVTPAMIVAAGAELWDALSHDPLISPGLADDLGERVLRVVLRGVHRKT